MIAAGTPLVSGLRELVDHLTTAADFLSRLKKTGGEIILIVELPGDYHFGDAITAEELLRLGTLGIELGIEVFPDIL